MVCNPTAAHRILRDESYGKPTESLSLLNIFGPTITGNDGSEARLYRKITPPFFHRDTINTVWTKSVAAASDLVQVANEHGRDLRPLLARLSLHILNEICFESTQDCLEVLRAREQLSPGHQLSYSHAIAYMLDHFPKVFLILGDAPPSEWSHDAHYLELASSHVGAVINEALRLFTVLQFIPKRSPATPHLFPLGNKKCVIPAHTLILVNTSAMHRQPNI